MEHFKLYNNTYNRDTDSAKASNDTYPLVTGVDFRDKIGTVLSGDYKDKNDNSLLDTGNVYGGDQAFKSLVNSVQYHEAKDDSKFQLYDILTYNSTTNTFGCYKPYESIPNGHTPIAVCVIPEELLPNDNYGENGDARFISLTELSSQWGNITDQNLYNLLGYTSNGDRYFNEWFGIYINKSGDNYYHYLIPRKYYDNQSSYESWTGIPIINQGTQSHTEENYILYDYARNLVSWTGCLPSDAFSSVSTKSWFLDTGNSNKADGYYYGSVNNSSNYECYIPSPYLLNGKLNPLYIADKYGVNNNSFSNNPLKRFDGRRKTLAIVKAALEADNWLWNTKNYDNTKGFTISTRCAAYQCFNYAPTNSGTSAGSISGLNPTLGDWYLPSIGELGFCCVRRAGINAVLNKLGGTLLSAGNYWSSSQYSTYYAYILYFYYGYVNGTTKNTALYVRPFLRKKKAEILS